MENSKIIFLFVPKYKELSTRSIYNKVKEFEEFNKYLPDYGPGELPEIYFLMAIVSTVNIEAMKSLIKTAREKRAICSNDQADTLVQIDPEIKRELLSRPVMKTSKGISHYLLKAKAKLKRAKRSQKDYSADLDALIKLESREESKDQEEK
mmetsp:Transcript_471/g.454  ORF Transcript_471/g.454 Transcript_471/m.454 type:complete len:151 (-) Transcript_471:37-489(-)